MNASERFWHTGQSNYIYNYQTESKLSMCFPRIKYLTLCLPTGLLSPKTKKSQKFYSNDSNAFRDFSVLKLCLEPALFLQQSHF